MIFPHRGLGEGVGRNFEYLEQSHLYWGVGAPGSSTADRPPVIPTTNPRAPGAFYLRLDTPASANQRIYVWNANTSTWTGIV